MSYFKNVCFYAKHSYCVGFSPPLSIPTHRRLEIQSKSKGKPTFLTNGVQGSLKHRVYDTTTKYIALNFFCYANSYCRPFEQKWERRGSEKHRNYVSFNLNVPPSQKVIKIPSLFLFFFFYLAKTHYFYLAIYLTVWF